MKLIAVGFVALFMVWGGDQLYRAGQYDALMRGVAIGKSLARQEQREQERGYMAAGLCSYSRLACNSKLGARK